MAGATPTQDRSPVEVLQSSSLRLLPAQSEEDAAPSPFPIGLDSPNPPPPPTPAGTCLAALLLIDTPDWHFNYEFFLQLMQIACVCQSGLPRQLPPATRHPPPTANYPECHPHIWLVEYDSVSGAPPDIYCIRIKKRPAHSAPVWSCRSALLQKADTHQANGDSGRVWEIHKYYIYSVV